VKSIYRECQCSLLLIDGLTTQENLGFTPQPEDECMMKPITHECVKNQVHSMKRMTSRMCPQCKPACRLSTYDVQVSQSKIIPAQFTRRHRHNNMTSPVSIFDAKNDAVVELMFDTTTGVNIIKEQPSFSLIDFLLYSANVFILLLGMSFVSFCEFFLYCVMYVKRRFV